MLCLGLDTCGQACSVAIVDDGRVLAGRSESMRRGHAEALAPMVKDVMTAAGLEYTDIDRLAVTTGPGAFTGIRVGLSFARGLALATGRPLIGINVLELWAIQADPDGDAHILSVHDSRRGDVTIASWEYGIPDIKPQRLSIADASAKIQTRMTLVGSGAHLLGGPGDDGQIDVEKLAWLALHKAAEGAPPSAFYHRPPDAKLPGGLDYTP